MKNMMKKIGTYISMVLTLSGLFRVLFSFGDPDWAKFELFAGIGIGFMTWLLSYYYDPDNFKC
jgi:hypothetical protein